MPYERQSGGIFEGKSFDVKHKVKIYYREFEFGNTDGKFKLNQECNSNLS